MKFSSLLLVSAYLSIVVTTKANDFVGIGTPVNSNHHSNSNDVIVKEHEKNGNEKETTQLEKQNIFKWSKQQEEKQDGAKNGNTKVENTSYLRTPDTTTQASTTPFLRTERRTLDMNKTPSEQRTASSTTKVAPKSDKPKTIQEQIQAKQNQRSRRTNGGDSISQLFSTPINQWSLEQFALFLVLCMFAFIVLGCCCCGGGGGGCSCYDILACWCCYEMCCDDGAGMAYGTFV